MNRARCAIWLGGMIAGAALPLFAQIDPVKRELVQMGYGQPLRGKAPLAGYLFYHLNLPQFYRSNLTWRLAAAPIYLDTELGISQALGPNTDVGLGAAGGGFADSYAELRSGKFVEKESFLGHGGGLAANVYHQFNPGALIPLNLVLRGETYYSTYNDDTDTDPAFVLPGDRVSFQYRAGLRWGGREPVVLPEAALELSAWYEGRYTPDDGAYGYAGDRKVERWSHLFWARGLFAYTLPALKHSFTLDLTLGTSIDPDRFAAYRIGGVLPMAAEFPLALPGYFHQELSADQFALLSGQYVLPLDARHRWSLAFVGTTGAVDYLPGAEQPGHWHSGAGMMGVYRSPSDVWQLMLGYSYGFDAIRGSERGAHSIGFLLQFDLERSGMHFFDPGENPLRSRGLRRILSRP